MLTQSIKEKYFHILKGYYTEQGEEYLLSAEELGQELLLEDVPPEEIAELHEDAIRRLCEEISETQLLDTIHLVSTPMMELLMAYGLSFRKWLKERQQTEDALRKQLEGLVKERTTELEEANLKLQDLDTLKSMFIASMSHELRTPLNSIIGFTGIILQGMTGEINEEQRKQLTMVKDSANHLHDLINDVIDVSKIEADKIELAIEEFDLSGLVREVKDSFKVTATEKGLDVIRVKVPKKLVVTSDERRTKQILVNLMSNAVKFTDEGETVIRVAKRDGRVEVSVRDTGIGIRKENMDKLFKAFSQIHDESMSIQEGTGLGLYLSKKIAGLLGGNISVKSEYGRGSEFIFTMPLRYKEAVT